MYTSPQAGGRDGEGEKREVWVGCFVQLQMPGSRSETETDWGEVGGGVDPRSRGAGTRQSAVWNLWRKRRRTFTLVCTQLDRWGGIRSRALVSGKTTRVTHSGIFIRKGSCVFTSRTLETQQCMFAHLKGWRRATLTSLPTCPQNLGARKGGLGGGRDYVCVFACAWSCFLAIHVLL